jgi:hypothetical protein
LLHKCLEISMVAVVGMPKETFPLQALQELLA